MFANFKNNVTNQDTLCDKDSKIFIYFSVKRLNGLYL